MATFVTETLGMQKMIYSTAEVISYYTVALQMPTDLVITAFYAFYWMLCIFVIVLFDKLIERIFASSLIIPCEVAARLAGLVFTTFEWKDIVSEITDSRYLILISAISVAGSGMVWHPRSLFVGNRWRSFVGKSR